MALEEGNGYEELVLYPPPFNYIIVPLLFISPSPETMKKYAFIFSQCYFWFENFFLVIGYFVYFILLSPIIFVKLGFYIGLKIDGVKNKIIALVGWIFLGFFYLLYNNLVDICILVNILCMHTSENFDINEEERSKEVLHKLCIYRNMTAALTQLYDVACSVNHV